MHLISERLPALNHGNAGPSQTFTSSRRRQCKGNPFNHCLDNRVFATAALPRFIGLLGLDDNMPRLNACRLVTSVTCVGAIEQALSILVAVTQSVNHVM